MLVFYDFEIFKHDWLVVIINPFEKQTTTIINNKEELEEYYTKHKTCIWCGYNSRSYDQWILKGILCGFNPYEISKHIIQDKKPAYTFSSLLNKISVINYDVMYNKNIGSLKTLEGFMGHDIQETGVPFNIDRKLTQEEIDKTIYYCTHDVEETIEVFLQTKNEFNSQLSLIKTFKLPLMYIGKTQAQLAAIILEANKKSFNDDWKIKLPNTLKLVKYKFVSDWFLNKNNHKEEAKLECNIAGIPTIVAWGGIHSALNKYQYTCKSDEIMVMADVDQLYPSLMIKYKLLSRSVKNYDKFQNILDTSLRLKREQKKNEREPYKRICNITYGAMGDKYNNMYDPLHRKLVCVYGQVLLIDLIEKLEPFCELIQSNTDGILIKLKEKDFDLLDDTVYEWEMRTGLHMSFDLYKRIYQKDVNNYIIVDFEGHAKTKGLYVKQLSGLDYDLPIINDALNNYMIKDISVEETINNCNDLIKFQKIVKVSGKYMCGWYGNKKLTDKTFRVFASTHENDPYIGKQKSEGATIEKFANTPEHCFINNNDIRGVKVLPALNKQWYIDLAKKRLKDFGIEV